MNAFTRLLSLPPARQDELGVRHTAAEIHQQPDVWPLVAEVLVQERLPLLRFLEEAGIAGQEPGARGAAGPPWCSPAPAPPSTSATPSGPPCAPGWGGRSSPTPPPTW